jgi:hypothetical protein
LKMAAYTSGLASTADLDIGTSLTADLTVRLTVERL